MMAAAILHNAFPVIVLRLSRSRLMGAPIDALGSMAQCLTAGKQTSTW